MKITDLKDYTVVGSASPVSVPKEQPKSIGQKVLDIGSGISNYFGAGGVSEQFGASLARANIPGAEKLGILKQTDQSKLYVDNPSVKKVVGSAIQTGANFLPGAGAGANLATKIAIGGATGYAFDVGSKLQKEDTTVSSSLEPGIGTAVGAGLPVAGAVIKPAVKFIGRLFKGIGSGLSGVSTQTIENIVDNPEVAQKASERLAKNGNNRILEENAKTIVNGVSSIQKEARKAFGSELEKLAETDIQPTVFREQTQKFLDGIGSSLSNGTRDLSNVEFTDPKNIQKANDLINKLQTVDLNGKSLRKLADDIENAAYKVATSDERLSFNAFVRGLSESLRGAITQSTGKLQEMNQKFSQDMQLAEAVQNIFGNVDYKNLPEVVKASQKLEGLFNQKGLAPEVVDNFLERIGVSSKNFRTIEAVRQIGQKTSGANSTGLSLGEITREATSALVTPNMVKQLAIITGITREKLTPFLQAMKPAARNILIQALLQNNQGNSK